MASGAILILLGTVPKFAVLATIIPAPVFGGANTIMFAMVTVSGIRTLASIDFNKNSNLLVMACSIGVGPGVSVVPGLLDKTPEKL
jgi:xanthine/uracil permease